MDSDPELLGTVTGGLYVREFLPVLQHTAMVNHRIQPWMRPAVLYKRSAAGVTAGATVPNRNFHFTGSRLYIRSSKLYQKG